MQIGVVSAAQLELHDHYNVNSGGSILTRTRVDSANVRISNGADRFTPNGVGVWALLKQIVVLDDTPGAMTINYDLTRGGGAGTIHGQARIYRAGALLWSGVDNAEMNGPTTYTDAAIAQDLLALDTIEVWGYVSAGAATNCHISNMTCSWDMQLTSIARWPITIPLAMTGAGILYVVNF